jgi:hypothetical protein
MQAEEDVVDGINERSILLLEKPIYKPCFGDSKVHIFCLVLLFEKNKVYPGNLKTLCLCNYVLIDHFKHVI